MVGRLPLALLLSFSLIMACGGEDSKDASADLSSPTSATHRTGEAQGSPEAVRTSPPATSPRATTSLGVYTIAGSGPPDVGDGGPAADATLRQPWGVHAAADGRVFVADTFQDRVRVVLPDGTIETVAGIGTAENANPVDGVLATQSPLRLPRDVEVGPSGDLFIADTNFYLIRRVDVSTGLISTVAGNRWYYPGGDGGPATQASLGFPFSIEVDDLGGIYLTDTDRIRYIDPAGTITTVIGSTSQGPEALEEQPPGCSGRDGPASSARIEGPSSIALDGVGGLLIGGGPCPVVRLDLSTMMLRLLSPQPSPVASSRSGDAYFIANGAIQRLDLKSGDTSTIVSIPNGQGAIRFSVAKSGIVYVADEARSGVWKVEDGALTRFAGSESTQRENEIGDSQGLAVDSRGNVYFSDFIGNRINRLSPDGQITTVAGNGQPTFAGDGGHPLNASFSAPTALRLDAFGNLFFIDETGGGAVVRSISPGPDGVIDGDPEERIVSVAGLFRPRSEADHGASDGSPATTAVFVGARDIAFDAHGNLYIADWLDHRVRKVVPGADGVISGDPDEIISTFAGTGVEAKQGDGGLATTASIPQPNRLAVDPNGNVFIAEANRAGMNIRRVDAETGIITSVLDLSDMTSGQMTFGPDGNLYYSNRLQILRVDPAGGAKTVVAGTREAGYNGDVDDPLQAQFRGIGFFTFDQSGAMYAADNGNFRIVKIIVGE